MASPWYTTFFFVIWLGDTINGYVLEPADNDTYIISWTQSDSNYILQLKENNHDGEEANHLLLFTLKELESDELYSSWNTIGSDFFAYDVIIDSDKGEYAFYTNQFIDYETETSHTRDYTCSLGTVDSYIIVTVNTINIDDESPTLTATMCNMDENTDYTQDTTNCTATLSDPDGWLGNTTFTILNSKPSATNQLERENELFEFYFDKSIGATEYNTTVYLITKMQLDYEVKIFYSFSVQAKDGAGHTTLPNENVTCIVDVGDLNDTPPQWTDFFSVAQITEKTNYTFSVTAVDGDRFINADIYYYLIAYDPDICTKSCVDIETVDGKGIITVNPIDRDARDLTTYKFEIMAQEDDDPPFTNNLTISLFLDDLDDNSPLFMNLTRSNETLDTDNLADQGPKIAEFTFYENFAGTVDGVIFIQDIDTGENAQFSVELLEDDDRDYTEVLYTDAFLIVPTAGYRSGDFTINVKNVTYLDFENEPWQNFSFNVHSWGTKNETNEDNLLVIIHLLDYNDELPIFSQESYSVNVPENIKKLEEIIEVKATDRDAEDAVLVHTLIGAETIISGMTIDPAEGVITVSGENYVFDFDRINPVIFQVQAVDKVNHTTTVPVTINLSDVNNKAPTYKVDNVISVEENQIIGIALNATITASDVDTTRDLMAEINWDASYAMKNSQRLTNTTENLKAMQFLNINYTTTSEDTISIILTVNDLNDAETAPDYETFDTLYLSVTITDLNTLVPEFESQKSTEALIIVNIIDINDNAPIFTNNTLEKNRTVYEKSAINTIVGTIEATDQDVGDVVEYACTYVNKSLDWFDCDLYGQITTKTAEVNADDGNVTYVSINCTATDGVHITPQIFEIYIMDTNDQIPQILVNDTTPSSTVVEVLEKSPIGTNVTHIGYTDGDRDIPFHTVICRISQTEECYESFEIDENSMIKVKVGGTDINRDEKKANYTCTPTCYDNPNLEQGQGQNTNGSASFLIKLIDINDHWPELVTEEIEASENSIQGAYLGDLIADDIDEGDNAEIIMSVLNVTKIEGEEEIDFTGEELFYIVKDEADYHVNDTRKLWHLTAKKDLRDYYGVYLVQLYLTDLGEPPQSSEAEIIVTIQKFNYYPPVFVFPTEEKLSFVLSSDQETGKPLALYYHNETFSNIEIKDGDNDDPCLDKWNPEFEVSLVNISSSATNFFNITPVDRCTAQLQVNDKYDKDYAHDIVAFQVRITVTLADATQAQGEEKYTEYIDVTFNFADVNDDPVFDQSLGQWNISFLEADDSLTMPLPEERKAYYANLENSDDLNKYYFLSSEDDEVSSTFEVEITDGTIGLKHGLDYLVRTDYTFHMVTGRNQSVGSSNSLSRMAVNVTVIEINNHVPQWTELAFFGAITRSMPKESVILTINATDLDTIDQGHLVYSINSSIDAVGSDNLKNIVEPFKLDSEKGSVTLNFQVEANMNGYFSFWVKVQDREDGHGNGPHENLTTVTISIVTGDNTVTFKFEIPLDVVVEKKAQMLATISYYLGWSCHEQDIDKYTKDGITYDNVTAANIYCTQNDSLLLADDMKTKLNNINTFQQLKQSLLDFGILLQSFTSDATAVDNLERSLKVALIAVTVVLGAMCLVLAITFFFKTRELNKRLTNLTKPKFGSDESQINRAGLNVPTSNMFATEGSNPVFNSHYEKDPLRAEVSSIHSGNSDLIGFEDSPEFDDMFGEIPHNDKIMHI